MIIFDTTTRSLEVDLNAIVTTNQLPFVVSYVDVSQSTFAMSAASANTGTSNNTTAVTLVAAPGATTSRQLKYLSIRNADTVATLLWVQMNDNGTLREIWKGTLAVNDTLVYVDTLGFNVINTSGQIKSGNGISSIGSSTDNAVTRWDGTGGTSLQDSVVIVSDTGGITGVTTLSMSSTLTLSGTAANIALGSNFISNGGTDAGLSFDGSNNATLSGNLIVSGTGTSTISGPLAISGASAGQIVFPATQNASAGANTFDDYKEQTFTPAITFGGAAVGVTYTTQTGVYTKIGRVVIFKLYIVLSNNGSSTGNLQITGLPFTSSNSAISAISVRLSGALGLIATCQGYVNNSATTISIETLSGGASTLLTEVEIGDTAQISVAGAYEV